jgi:hypothetical protein
MPKDLFGTSLLTLLGVSLVLWKGWGKQITSVVTQFYCPLSPNSQTSEFLIYSLCTFKILGEKMPDRNPTHTVISVQGFSLTG